MSVMKMPMVVNVVVAVLTYVLTAWTLNAMNVTKRFAGAVWRPIVRNVRGR